MSSLPHRGLTHLGMDVHKDSISIGILAPEDETPEVDKVFHDEASVRRLVARLGDPRRRVACYEAGPTGYELQRLLVSMGVACEVVAPSLIPRCAADRVKTDRRDAPKLARLHRAGELTAIRVPTRREEAVRDLCRARGDVVADMDRARKRLGAFLLRHSVVWRGGSAWTMKHHEWLSARHFEDPAMAATFAHYLSVVDAREREMAAAEADLAAWYGRDPFAEAVRRLCAYRGVRAGGVDAGVGSVRLAALHGRRRVPGLHRSDPLRVLKRRAHVAGAHHQGGQLASAVPADRVGVGVPAGPSVGVGLRKRQDGVDPATIKRARAAQVLCARFRRLAARKNSKNVVATAVARELCGFLWAEMTAA